MSRTLELERRIVAVLKEDARLSNREVGRRLAVSEGAVRARVKRMIEAGVIKFGALVAPEALGLACTAMVRLTVSPEHSRAVADNLSNLDAVQFVGLSAGHFNVVAVFVVADQIRMETLLSAISQLPGVVDTNVRRNVEVMKHRYDQIRIRVPT